jgi:hypothetical protein
MTNARSASFMNIAVMLASSQHKYWVAPSSEACGCIGIGKMPAVRLWAKQQRNNSENTRHGKIYFGGYFVGYGSFCLSRAYVQSGSGQYHEPEYLAVAPERYV